MKKLLLILGDQLFDFKTHYERFRADLVFMAEDEGLCTHYCYHQLKILMFLSAMREYRDTIPKSVPVAYFELAESGSYLEKLRVFCQKNQVSHLVSYEVEDEFFEKALGEFARTNGLTWETHPSPAFLGTRADFQTYLRKKKRPFMKTFYEARRRSSGILMKKDRKIPEGGKFSHDEENRKPLPKDIKIPEIFQPTPSRHFGPVTVEIQKRFSTHPGVAPLRAWFPVTRKHALKALELFISQRLPSFGPYEDAWAPNEVFLFHSALSPSLNMGLLTPKEVIEAALEAFREKRAPLASVEGFVRQIMGWREFIRGIYQNFRTREETENFFGHARGLTAAWYTGTTGLDPLDHVIRRVKEWGYAHHIERLMILSNVMLLSELHPRDVHRWFMEMFIDSADWVMGPNVYGMGQFSDGGLFATKPYICGSNYWLKMGRFSKGPWCEILDGLYWSFISKHRDFYARNPRMSVMVKALEKMDKKRRDRLFGLAQDFRAQMTSASEAT